MLLFFNIVPTVLTINFGFVKQFRNFQYLAQSLESFSRLQKHRRRKFAAQKVSQQENFLPEIQAIQHTQLEKKHPKLY